MVDLQSEKLWSPTITDLQKSMGKKKSYYNFYGLTAAKRLQSNIELDSKEEELTRGRVQRNAVPDLKKRKG
ncbi:hypothetical protein DY000_02033184 [Brassica cretica]|uniref:Uncharacterized protein n=1 Tax=Brassica cretica TaxID=69181 RepID=A0ABQ7DXA8_BRACR|nr:hypothetical protein DY000_02033184 [Brassica cretica]